MQLSEVIFAPATEQSRLVRAGELSAVELVDAYLDRIERIDGSVGAYVTVAADSARQAARAAQDRLPLGDLPPLLGVPVSVKELNDVAGLPSTSGLAALRGRLATADDNVVRRMRAAGAIVIGKTTSPALGIGCVSEPAGFAPARNPWDLSRTPGGSSGGAAAALAAGLCAISQGSDGGGSIRIPASWCGLVGLKPSRGRVSSAPQPSSLLSTCGPITRTVLDAAVLLDVISGPELGDAYWAAPPLRPFADEVGRDPGRLRIAVSLGGRDIDEGPRAALDASIEVLTSLGHVVEEADPDPTWGWVIEESLHGLRAPGVAAVAAALPTQDGLDPLLASLIEYSASLSAQSYVETHAAMLDRARRVTMFFGDYDALLCPTVAKGPPRVGEHRDLDVAALFATWEGYVPFTTMWNWTGQPAISLPVGLDAAGLPVGIQLVGRPGGDSGLLRLASQLEAAVRWEHIRPAL